MTHPTQNPTKNPHEDKASPHTTPSPQLPQTSQTKPIPIPSHTNETCSPQEYRPINLEETMPHTFIPHAPMMSPQYNPANEMSKSVPVKTPLSTKPLSIFSFTSYSQSPRKRPPSYQHTAINQEINDNEISVEANNNPYESIIDVPTESSTYDYDYTITAIEKNIHIKSADLKKLMTKLLVLGILAIPSYFVGKGSFECGENIGNPDGLSAITGLPSAWFQAIDNVVSLPLMIGIGGGFANMLLIMRSMEGIYINRKLFTQFLFSGLKSIPHWIAALSASIAALGTTVGLLEAESPLWLAILNGLENIPPHILLYFLIYIDMTRPNEQKEMNEVLCYLEEKFNRKPQKKLRLMKDALKEVVENITISLDEEKRSKLMNLSNFLEEYLIKEHLVQDYTYEQDKKVEHHTVSTLKEIFHQLDKEGKTHIKNQILMSFAITSGYSKVPTLHNNRLLNICLGTFGVIASSFNYYNLASMITSLSRKLDLPESEVIGYIFAVIPMITKVTMYLRAMESLKNSLAKTKSGAIWLYHQPWFMKTAVSASVGVALYCFFTSAFCAANSSLKAWENIFDGLWEAFVIDLLGEQVNDILKISKTWAALIGSASVNIFAGLLPALLSWNTQILNNFVGMLGFETAKDAKGSLSDLFSEESETLVNWSKETCDNYLIQKKSLFSNSNNISDMIEVYENNLPIKTEAPKNMSMDENTPLFQSSTNYGSTAPLVTNDNASKKQTNSWGTMLSDCFGFLKLTPHKEGNSYLAPQPTTSNLSTNGYCGLAVPFTM
jgi:hypothetical protein